MVYWLVIIWTLNIFDLAFTLTATQTGLFDEANPWVKPYVDMGQMWNIFAFKMMFLLLATWLFARNRRHWFCEAGLIAATLVYLGVAAMWLAHTPLFETFIQSSALH
ncbi:MAG: hypothetical protein BIFFINMI_00692 [Phycisphaerae bacterium]|nr:hypothetical protein [Phycisphaerae bacterium]